MIQLKELLQLSPYLQTAQLTTKSGSKVNYPKIDIPLNKDTYFYIESSLSKLIETYKELKKDEKVVLKTGRELEDITFKNAKYSNGNYVFENTKDEESINQILFDYSDQLKSVQDSYRYLIA